MSILKRYGFEDNTLLEEGLLHNDALKQRITNMFVRTSLGNSPTYTVSKIAELIKRNKGETFDAASVTDQDILTAANDALITRNKFSPQLRNPNSVESQPEVSTPSAETPAEVSTPSEPVQNTPEIQVPDTSKYLPTPTEIKKESKETKEFAKLSPKAQNVLIVEQYRQRMRQQYLFEEKYKK